MTFNLLQAVKTLIRLGKTLIKGGTLLETHGRASRAKNTETYYRDAQRASPDKWETIPETHGRASLLNAPVDHDSMLLDGVEQFPSFYLQTFCS